MKHFIASIALLIAISANAQDKYDSLYTVLDTAKNELRVNTLNELCKSSINTNPQNALEFTKTALELAIKLDYKRGIAVSYNNLGVLYKNNGIYDKAIDYYIKSLEIHDAIDDLNGVASSKNNIGTIYSVKSNYELALKYFTESYDIVKELEDDEKIVGSLNNIGNVYLGMGNVEKALTYFTDAVNLYEQIGQKNKAFDPLNSLGNIYFYQQEYDRALDYYSLSLLIEQENDNKAGQAYAHNNIGAIYQKKGDSNKALEHHNKALRLADELGAKPLLQTIYKSLSETYYDQKRLDEAYQALLMHSQIKDFVYSEESSRKLARLEVAMEIKDKEKQFELHKKQNTINELEDQNYKTIIIVSVMAFMLLSAFLFVYITVKRKLKPGNDKR